jgi:hypothetical protein
VHLRFYFKQRRFKNTLYFPFESFEYKKKKNYTTQPNFFFLQSYAFKRLSINAQKYIIHNYVSKNTTVSRTPHYLPASHDDSTRKKKNDYIYSVCYGDRHVIYFVG